MIHREGPSRESARGPIRAESTPRILGLLAIGFASTLLIAEADAQVTWEMIGDCAAQDISADGSVVVGNLNGTYETFRWTEETGIVALGRSTAPLGVGAGTPDVSADGTRVSATIIGEDETYVTQGIWIEGSGWTETMPPPPSDGGLLDLAYGSAWGLSDDGTTLVGLYWRPGHSGGLAHASSWTETTDVVDLGSSGRDSRANDASYDGSVIVGWDSNPGFGNWRAAVWVDGVMTILSEPDAFISAQAVTPDGTIVVGQTYDVDNVRSTAAAWRWDGANWIEEMLGFLPGTSPTQGTVMANDLTADGSMIVGYNRFSNPGNATGFIWTEELGLVDVEDWLEDHGIVDPEPNFDILSLTGVSDDGRTIVGIGANTEFPFQLKTFIIRIWDPTDVSSSETSFAEPRLVATPNPTRGATTFALEIDEPVTIGIGIYDASGRQLRTLEHGSVGAGSAQIRWDGLDASGLKVCPGVYFYRLEAAGAKGGSEKLVIIR